MSSELINFSLIFATSVFGGALLKRLRLPSLLAYVSLGLFLSYRIGNSGADFYFSFVGSLGVMLLLFLVGLEMKVEDLGNFGSKGGLLALSQLLLTGLGFVLIQGKFNLSGVFLATCLSLSSTILVAKFLNEKRDLDSLQGRISLSLLLFQDLFAVGLMVVLANRGLAIHELALRSLVLAVFVVIVGRSFWRRLIDNLTKDREEGLLVAMGWCFFVAALASSSYVGLSMEIGGFLAGLSLSGSMGSGQIAARIRPMKDFFIAVFFISLGTRVNLIDLSWLRVAYLSAAVLIVKPLLVWFLLRISGQSQRVSLISGLLLGQISEFALVLVVVGERIGILSLSQVSEISAVGFVSLTLSSVVLLNIDLITQKLRSVLDMIWRDESKKQSRTQDITGHVVLVGCQRMGKGILHQLDKLEEPILVVDFDPDVIKKMSERGYETQLADISDPESYRLMNLQSAKLVISTISDVRDNSMLIAEVKGSGSKAKIVIAADNHENLSKLYKEGADYVIFPQYVGGVHLGQVIRKVFDNGADEFSNWRDHQKVVMEKVFTE